jgi:predicted dienelactone hydrolase
MSLMRVALLVGLVVIIPTTLPSFAQQTERTVGAITRQFVPTGTYNWRGARTQALVTTIWYPASADTQMLDHYVGPPTAPLFRLGRWADDGTLAVGRFPLVVLSHGTGGSAQIMAWLGRALAADGYIVAGVNHPGNNALEPYTAEGFLLWWERAHDVSATIDLLLRDEQFGRSIDRRRIGAIGFSLGGYTMLELAGARTDPRRFQQFCRSSVAEGCLDPPEFPNLFSRWAELESSSVAFRDAVRQAGRSYRDSRIRAIVAIAPALGPAFTPDSLRRITTPMEIIAGANDPIVPIASNAGLVTKLTPPARLTLLPGAGHYTFLAICTDDGRRAQPNLCSDAPEVDRAAIHRRTVDLAVQFFDQNLR